jgi:hypothetical protein
MIESSLRVRDDLVADSASGFWPADYDVAWAA